MQGVEEILKSVCRNFNENNVEYAIVGGFTVIFYGVPRTTMDIDVVIPVNNGFFASADDMQAAFRERTHCTIEHRETMFRVDVKGVYNEMDRRTIKNRVSVDFHGMNMYQK
jgi:hypothetical protein